MKLIASHQKNYCILILPFIYIYITFINSHTYLISSAMYKKVKLYVSLMGCQRLWLQICLPR